MDGIDEYSSCGYKGMFIYNHYGTHAEKKPLQKQLNDSLLWNPTEIWCFYESVYYIRNHEVIKRWIIFGNPVQKQTTFEHSIYDKHLSNNEYSGHASCFFYWLWQNIIE